MITFTYILGMAFVAYLSYTFGVYVGFKRIGKIVADGLNELANNLKKAADTTKESK